MKALGKRASDCRKMLHLGCKLDKKKQPAGPLSAEDRDKCLGVVREYESLRDAGGLTLRPGCHAKALSTLKKVVTTDGAETRLAVSKVAVTVDGIDAKVEANTAALQILTKEVRVGNARSDPANKATRVAVARSLTELHKSVLKLVKAVETCVARDVRLSLVRKPDPVQIDVARAATSAARSAATEAMRLFQDQHPDETTLITRMRSAAVLAGIDSPAASSSA